MLAPETDQGDVGVGDSPKLLALPKRKKPLLVDRLKGHILSEEEILVRREKAFELRLAGKTMETIGKELGVSTTTIHHDLKAIAKMKYEGLIEQDQLLILTHNRQYDALKERLLEHALTPDLNIGEVRQNRRGEDYDVSLASWEASYAAIDRLLKVMADQAKLNGLMTPVAIRGANDRTPEEVGTAVALSVMEGMRRLAERNQPLRAEIIDEPRT